MIDFGNGLGCPAPNRLGRGGPGYLRTAVGISLALLGLAACQSPPGGSVEGTRAEVSQDAPAQVSPDRLAAQWVRSDGGYMLELSGVAADGQLHAAYFNPRPINVDHAEWSRKEGHLTVFVELRDVNYPGSTYTLQYDPDSDQLRGVYFQAVTQESYQIEFQKVSNNR